jgi:hypothetical protein
MSKSNEQPSNDYGAIESETPFLGSFLNVGTRIENGPSWKFTGPGFNKPMTDDERQRVTTALGQISAIPENDPSAFDG